MINDGDSTCVSLAPDGKIRLWYNNLVFVDIPVNGAGMKILQHLLEGRAAGLKRLAEPGALTQEQVNELVLIYFRDKPKKELEQISLEGIEI